MENNRLATVLPLRIMRPGLPPADTVGRVLLNHVDHGFMIGEVVDMSERGRVTIGIGIQTDPARSPIAIRFTEDQASKCLEWCPLEVTVKPADRARASH